MGIGMEVLQAYTHKSNPSTLNRERFIESLGYLVDLMGCIDRKWQSL
jgi:hypothetical protein